jgi:hypothetical protein
MKLNVDVVNSVFRFDLKIPTGATANRSRIWCRFNDDLSYLQERFALDMRAQGV